MKTLIVGLFTDTETAGHAISDLKEKGYTDDISVVAKKAGDTDDEVREHQIKQDVSDGASAGAATGGTVGALAGLIAGMGAAMLPGGIVLMAAGPLTAAWTAGGAVAGALSGGLIGALVDWGIPKNKAAEYEEHILQGEALVTVTVDHDDRSAEEKVSSIMSMHNVHMLGAYTTNE